MSLKYAPYRLMVALIVAGFLAFPGSVRAQAVPPEKPEKGIASPETLPRGFEQSIAQLQEYLKTWESRVPAAEADLAQTQKELDNLQVAVASVKATMVLQKLSMLQVEELLDLYADREKALKGKLKDLGQEIDDLKKSQQEHVESQNALRVQLSIIQAKNPAAVTPELQQAFLTYLNLAGDRDRLMTRVLAQLEQRRRLLEQEQELLAGLTPQLQQLEAAWKSQLLKRPAAAVPFREQVVLAWKSLAVIPQRGWDWLNGLVESGRLSAFLWRHLAPIIGLLGFIMLLGWSTRRFNDLVTRRFRTWRERAADIHLLPLYVLGQALVANLFGLGLILWLGLFFWTFNLIGSAPAQLILAALVTLWALRLTIQWVQGFFAGQTAGGVLALDRDVARFYRRSLKLFLVYLCLGILGLKSAGLLNFPESSRLFVEHFFLLGILVWGFWLLRRPYLTRLLPQLSAPTWLHQPVVGLFLRGLLLFLLVVIILADLLGFQNLSMYLAQAAVWTLLAVVILWFLWLMGETIIAPPPASGSRPGHAFLSGKGRADPEDLCLQPLGLIPRSGGGRGPVVPQLLGDHPAPGGLGLSVDDLGARPGTGAADHPERRGHHPGYLFGVLPVPAGARPDAHPHLPPHRPGHRGAVHHRHHRALRHPDPGRVDRPEHPGISADQPGPGVRGPGSGDRLRPPEHRQ